MSTTRAVSKSSAAHSPYQRLFMLPGAKAFCLSGAVARLPISMMSLGIVLALNHLYDNWTIAGTMSAAYVLAMSCVTPFYARAFDRFGQARVGRLALAVQIVAMLAFAFAALVRVPIPLLFALAIIMGLTQFSFGALVRTRWSYALRGVEDGEQLLNTAYAMGKPPLTRSSLFWGRFWRLGWPPPCIRYPNCSCPPWHAASAAPYSSR